MTSQLSPHTQCPNSKENKHTHTHTHTQNNGNTQRQNGQTVNSNMHKNYNVIVRVPYSGKFSRRKIFRFSQIGLYRTAKITLRQIWVGGIMVLYTRNLALLIVCTFTFSLLYRYFKQQQHSDDDKLPDPQGPLSIEIPSTAIVSANEEVSETRGQ